MGKFTLYFFLIWILYESIINCKKWNLLWSYVYCDWLLLSRTRRLPKKVSLLAFLISFVLLFCEVALYRHFNILRDLTSMYICLVPAVYFLVNYLLKVNIPYRKMFTILRHDSLMIYTSHILFAKIFLALMPHAHLVVYFLTLACAQCLAGFVTRYQDQYPILKKLL